MGQIHLSPDGQDILPVLKKWHRKQTTEGIIDPNSLLVVYVDPLGKLLIFCDCTKAARAETKHNKHLDSANSVCSRGSDLNPEP